MLDVPPEVEAAVKSLKKGKAAGVDNLGVPPTHALKWLGCNCVQIMCNTSSAYHMQRVVCHVV